MLVIPLQAVPNQVVSCNLAGQPVQLHVRTLTTGLFVDIYLNNAILKAGMIAQDRHLLVRDAYWGFTGDLAFFDTLATPPNYEGEDPTYTGLGAQFLLVYLTPAEVASFESFTYTPALFYLDDSLLDSGAVLG